MIGQSTSDTPTLRKDAIGLREVLFQSITDMAPAAAIAASIPAGAAFAGGSLPLSVVFALIAALFSAVSIAELAGRIPAAGSLATYVARGLHKSLGFLTAWSYVLVGILISPLVLLQLGFTAADTFHSSWHWSQDLWWVYTVIGALIVMLAGLYGIRTSAGLGTILGIFEIAVFVVLGVMLIVHAGSANTLSVFGTGHTPSDHAGITGVIAGSVYTTLALLGFEGAAPLAEETRDPRRTIRKAILLATLSIGIGCSPTSRRPRPRWSRLRSRPNCPSARPPNRRCTTSWCDPDLIEMRSPQRPRNLFLVRPVRRRTDTSGR